MITLPLALRIEKNKVVSTAPWLLTIAATMPDTSVIRLVANSDDIVWAGNTYLAFPFELDADQSSSDRSVSEVSLKISNVTRAVQPYLELYSGMVGCNVRVCVVHADNLSEDYSALTLDYQVIASNADEQWITFQLGQPNLMTKRFPLYTATPNHCPWKFKSASCGYAGAVATCDNTVDSCRAKGNSPRFGGRPGLQSPGAKYL